LSPIGTFQIKKKELTEVTWPQSHHITGRIGVQTQD
jgi:hypothetical protein